jgi:hypothetical protein
MCGIVLPINVVAIFLFADECILFLLAVCEPLMLDTFGCGAKLRAVRLSNEIRTAFVVKLAITVTVILWLIALLSVQMDCDIRFSSLHVLWFFFFIVK